MEKPIIAGFLSIIISYTCSEFILKAGQSRTPTPYPFSLKKPARLAIPSGIKSPPNSPISSFPYLSAIVDGAFSPSALKGGILGVLVIGFQRAAFSNEAGVGSAAIAHSAAKTNHPPSEGFVALLEPFIDTVVVCTLTALVLIFTGMHEVEGMAGAQLTSDAFGSQISWFPYILALAVFLFAFSTMISWSYYGMRAWTYLFGKSKRSEMIYKMLFLVFVVVGASVSLGAVLDFSDMMILAMSFPNIIGLYIMSGEVRKDLDGYLAKLKAGQLFKKLKS